jgi:hypothetical protein
MRIFVLAAVSAITVLAWIGAPAPARAITISSIAVNDTSFVPSTSTGFQLPDFGSGFAQPALGDLPNVYRSPWENTIYENTLTYTSVESGVVGYNLTGNTLSLFWGSVDTYNSLTFFTQANGGGDSVSLDINALGGPQQLGHHLVVILTDQTFQSIEIGSSQAAFEFANLIATPIPPALPLFGGGLAALRLLSRRKKKRATV